MHGLKRWFRLRSVERDVDEEIASYYEECVRDLEERGWSRAAAREEALRRFGDARVYRTEMMMIDRRLEQQQRVAGLYGAARDVMKHAVRNVSRAPALSVGIVLALALGIGANATMYRTIERLLLKPPSHIVEPDQVRRLLVQRQTGPGDVRHGAVVTYPDYEDFARTSAFSHVIPHATRELTIGAGEAAQQVHVVLAPAAYWEMLGVQPALGRFFEADEDVRDGDPVVVVSWRFWQRYLGGSADALGRTVDFGRGPYTIIGVAPRGFTGVDLRSVELFLPFLPTAIRLQGGEDWATEREWYWLQVFARLKPGATVEEAEAEATTHHRAGRRVTPGYDPAARVVAAPLLVAQGPNAPAEATVARWLVGVAAIVLLIACLNVANLLLARMIRQHREVSIRLVLGISRRRLIAQVMTEGVLLALLGGAAALLVATWGGGFVQRALLPDVEWVGGPGASVIALVALLSLFAGLLTALVPALQAARRDVGGGLRTTAGGVSRSTSRVRASLAIVQAALSVVLLVGAGLFVRSLDRVRHGDLGLDPWSVAHVGPVFHTGTQLNEVERRDLFLQLAERLERVPGVTSAAAGRGIPFWSTYETALRVPGVDSIPRTGAGGPYVNMVSNDYFATTGLRVVRGRAFDSRDVVHAAAVVVVSESFAAALWPGQSPIGRCMHVGGDEQPCAEVIGVVRDAKHDHLTETEPAYQYYVPIAQRTDARPDALLVRTHGSMAPVLAAAQRELLAADPRIRFVRSRPLEEILAPQLRQWRLGATLFTTFGLLALLVAAIGLYSVLAFDVAQRVREIGLRTALGATPREIVRLVVVRAVRINGAGLLVGMALAIVFAPRLRDLLYRVDPRDPLTYVVVASSLMLVSLLAAGLPAWRASRVDPNVALRAE